MANAKKRQERNRSGGGNGGGPGSLLSGGGGGAPHHALMGTDTSDSERDEEDLNMQDLATLGWTSDDNAEDAADELAVSSLENARDIMRS